MKKILLLCCALLLIGCDNGNTSSYSSNNYDESFSNNLNSLLIFKDTRIVYDDSTYIFDFDCYYVIPENEDNVKVIVLEFSYNEVQIDNVKIIALPFSYNTTPTSVVNIGYYGQNYTIGDTLDTKNNIYKGLRVMFKTYDIYDDVKVFFSGIYDENKSFEKIFFIDKEDINEKVDINVE